jgi:predicted GIY-YIG superfamily endonuclease
VQTQPKRNGLSIASADYMADQCIVYVLKTANTPTRYYTGRTSDLEARLRKHNGDGCPSTAGRGPWAVDVSIHFTDEQRAVRFERYLKSGSGSAFAVRHFR